MKLLIVVDMQKDFIDGVLGTPEAVAIVPKVKQKVRQYENNRDYILYTRDTHTDEYLNTQEGKYLPVPHCIYESDGWQIHYSVYTPCRSEIVDKFCFGKWDIGNIVNNIVRNHGSKRGEQLESIEIVGLCTDICVISNAMILKSYFPETPISVDSSCCAGVTPASHQNALEAMKMCQIEIV